MSCLQIAEAAAPLLFVAVSDPPIASQALMPDRSLKIAVRVRNLHDFLSSSGFRFQSRFVADGLPVSEEHDDDSGWSDFEVCPLSSPLLSSGERS